MEKFTEDHEYIRVEDNVATIGITKHAQDELGEVVFIELPEVGQEVSKGDDVAVVESVKAASDVYSPVSGEIVEANGKIVEEPSLVNKDPEGDAWFFKVKLSDTGELDELLDETAYQALLD